MFTSRCAADMAEKPTTLQYFRTTMALLSGLSELIHAPKDPTSERPVQNVTKVLECSKVS